MIRYTLYKISRFISSVNCQIAINGIALPIADFIDIHRTNPGSQIRVDLLNLINIKSHLDE